MVHVPDELIMAYADGQVSPEEKVWLESILAVDPAVRSRLDVFVATGPGQFSPFDSVLTAPIPDRLIATVRGTRPEKRAAAPRQSFMERMFPNGFGGLQAVGYAAALAIGVGLGSALMTAPDDKTPLIVADRDGFVASGDLQVALDTKASGDKELVNEGDVRPVLTVRDGNGRICRHYEIVQRRKGPQGLACRQANGQWRITVLTGGEAAASARNASQGEPDVLDGMVGAAIKSMPAHSELTGVEEAYLIENGWGGVPALPGPGAGN
ncbi:MAG: hypothetical protein MUE84_17350 [Hyphomonas sp.]|jgi:surface antigen|nr:hypothetical protein [Hyphomonas sp.]